VLAQMFRFCKTSICPKHPMLQDTSQQLLLDDVQLASLLNKLKLASGRSAPLEQRARVGSYINVTSSDFTESFDFQLVEPCDSRPERNRISYFSPLGAAVLGQRAGTEITVPTSNSPEKWVITDVRQYRGDI